MNRHRQAFDGAEALYAKWRLSAEFGSLSQITDKWWYIRQMYLDFMPDIIEMAKKDITRWADVYPLDWYEHFTDAEKLTWHSIRARRVVLYPQFPAFQWLIDFANPYLRVGLEIDGSQHKPDKDRERDEQLAGIGWRIFRVPASQVFASIPDFSEICESGLEGEERETAIKRWMLQSDDGVVHALERIVFSSIEPASEEEDPEQDMIQELAYRTLDVHRLARFPIQK